MSCPSLSISSGIFSFNLATEFWDTFQFCCIGCCHMRCNEWLHPSFLGANFLISSLDALWACQKPWPWTSFNEAGFSCALSSLSDVLTFLKSQGPFMWNYSCFVWKERVPCHCFFNDDCKWYSDYSINSSLSSLAHSPTHWSSWITLFTCTLFVCFYPFQWT